MLASPIHTKWVARFCVLIPLLLNTSIGNAFWCTGVTGKSHLELNLISECESACHPEDEKYQRNSSTEPASDDSCVDTAVYSSFITSPHQYDPPNKIAVTDLEQTHFVFLPVKHSGGARTTSMFLVVSQLPPPQALTTLFTVVLLH